MRDICGDDLNINRLDHPWRDFSLLWNYPFHSGINPRGYSRASLSGLGCLLLYLKYRVKTLQDAQMSYSNTACFDIESKLLLSTKLLEGRERVDCKRHAMFWTKSTSPDADRKRKSTVMLSGLYLNMACLDIEPKFLSFTEFIENSKLIDGIRHAT